MNDKYLLHAGASGLGRLRMRCGLFILVLLLAGVHLACVSQPAQVMQPTSSPTYTVQPTLTPTHTPLPAHTPTMTATLPPTHTPAPTNTPRPTKTPAPTQTWTPTPTSTSTSTPVPPTPKATATPQTTWADRLYADLVQTRQQYLEVNGWYQVLYRGESVRCPSQDHALHRPNYVIPPELTALRGIYDRYLVAIALVDEAEGRIGPLDRIQLLCRERKDIGWADVDFDMQKLAQAGPIFDALVAEAQNLR